MREGKHKWKWRHESGVAPSEPANGSKSKESRESIVLLLLDPQSRNNMINMIPHYLTRPLPPDVPIVAGCGVRIAGCWMLDAVFWTLEAGRVEDGAVQNLDGDLPSRRHTRCGPSPRLREHGDRGPDSVWQTFPHGTLQAHHRYRCYSHCGNMRQRLYRRISVVHRLHQPVAYASNHPDVCTSDCIISYLPRLVQRALVVRTASSKNTEPSACWAHDIVFLGSAVTSVF